VATGSSATITFTPTDNGDYSATFTVTDNQRRHRNEISNLPGGNVAPQNGQRTGPTISMRTARAFGVTFTDPGSADMQTIAWAVRDANNNVLLRRRLSFNWTPSFSGYYNRNGDCDG